MTKKAYFEASWTPGAGEGVPLDVVLDGTTAPQGVSVCTFVDPADPPATVTVLVNTSAAGMAALKANPALLWLADCNSPITDAAVSAAKVNDAVQWLRDHGYTGAAFGQAISEIAKTRRRRDLAGAVAKELHGIRLDDLERVNIG